MLMSKKSPFHCLHTSAMTGGASIPCSISTPNSPHSQGHALQLLTESLCLSRKKQRIEFLNVLTKWWDCLNMIYVAFGQVYGGQNSIAPLRNIFPYLARCGALIFCRLCVLLDTKTVHRKLTTTLQMEPD